MAKLKYTTVDNDTYDMIALDVYNDEFLGSRIADANPLYAGVVVFSAGVELTIPILEQEAVSKVLPPWRR